MNTRLILSALLVTTFSSAADWTRFRGPNGSGIAPDDKPVPTEWSDDKNLKWKIALPGPGSSSPIITGDRVFITCWSGYGTDADGSDDQTKLMRHLLCLDRATGKTLWDRAIAAKLPEDRYGGMFAQHGYATHTPVTDGKSVFVFFGKSGVFAFDLEGKQLWQADVGDGLDGRNWGSASSPIIHDGAVIVTAGPESLAMYAFETSTGKQLWKSAADGFHGNWGTPIISTVDGRADIVISVPGEIWAFNPESGKLRWYSQGLQSDSVCNSAVTDGGVIYAMGERGGGSLAVRAGGSGDVSKTHINWTGSNGSRISTPILWEGRLHWVSGSLVTCRDAKTGTDIYEERIPGAAAQPERGGFNQGGGGRRGGMSGQDYASPVAAGGNLYHVTRRGEVLVIKLGPAFEIVARNSFASDKSDFSATPAISDGQLFIRSARNLYCIAQ